MHYKCPTGCHEEYNQANWVQNFGWNAVWTRAGVEPTFNWVHKQQVYTNGRGDLEISVLQKRRLARPRKSQDIFVRFVGHLLVGIPDGCFYCVLSRLGSTGRVPYNVSNPFSGLGFPLLFGDIEPPYSIGLVEVVVPSTSYYPCTLLP